MPHWRTAGAVKTAFGGRSSPWTVVVFPALAINYLGQGAFALHFLSSAAGHAPDAAEQDWFF